ncbi:unnamed protein product [Owenia fusiformis]|uniref:Uncharacterized protein n=1 Tax=Owenia fusiformis TaxID=6347 RepID=A0A8J1TG61_OWEFU|nr:unnamed protein product [Owenia fusiformis]
MDLPKVQVDYATREGDWQFNPNPELYAEVATQFQRRNANTLLKELCWSYLDDIILDIGCNNGDVTKMLLSKSDQIHHIMACDILAPCIEYAKQKNADANITYIEMDVCKEWPTSWENRFDKVFSNECLNMIVDNQENVLKKVFNSLKPGGELGASYFLRIDGIQAATLTLMESEKWKKYFTENKLSKTLAITQKNIEKMVWCDEQVFPKMLEKIGFQVKLCKSVQSWSFLKIDCTFIKGTFDLFFKFYHQIPTALQGDYLTDMVSIIKEIEMMKFQFLSDKGNEWAHLMQDESNDKHPLCQELIIIHCVKPNVS